MRFPVLLPFLAVSLGAPALLVACSSSGGAAAGGRDGGQSEAQAEPDSGPYPLANLDEPCEGGLTGRQLLAAVAPAYGGTYAPPTARPPSAPWRGPTTPLPVALGVTYDGGTILCTPVPPYNCCSGCPCAEIPGPSLSVDFNMTFKTTDGTFDEAFVATVTWQGPPRADWGATLPVADIKGTYPVSIGSTKLEFVGSFSDGTSSGGISELSSQISFSAGSWSADAGAEPTDAAGE